MEKLLSILEGIYPRDELQCVAEVLEAWQSNLPQSFPKERGFSHRDAVMIAYADSFHGDGAPPLRHLYEFLCMLEGAVSGLHILPFFPYSSDDGFSIVDYKKVREDYGDWSDVRKIGEEFRLMVDLVMNHCSKSHEWFRRFLEREEPWSHYFIALDPDVDLSGVFRPRPHPLLTPFRTKDGTLHVWTTFSDDQVDLNFAEARVLAEMMDTLCFYISKGAEVIRLDAVAYVWKEVGTSSIHHEHTHRIIRFMRAVLETLAPWVSIITETNVPHEENMSYFGKGDEAHMVYQFSLPPLLLDACIQQDACVLSAWAATLPEVTADRCFFNFAASHDGIGLLPSYGLLDDERRETLIETVKARGGRVSYKATPQGDIPYEMNISYLSAIADPKLPAETRARIFLCSQAILLSLAGLPAIYYHSLVGSENWQEGVAETGHNRSVNRRKLEFSKLVEELNDPGTLRAMVFHGYKKLLKARSEAFAPDSGQEVVELHPSVFALLRGVKTKTRVLCLHNVSSEAVELAISSLPGDATRCRDLLAEKSVQDKRASLRLPPYAVSWLEYGGAA